MTYFTLQLGEKELSLADWGIMETWRREVSNQASDSFAFDLLTATDGAESFPFGTMVTIRKGRVPVLGPATNLDGTPVSGVTDWTGGCQWFVGYRVDNVRVGSATLEGMQYKFAGPWDFFFERLVFQKLWLTYNGTKQIADWRSQVVLGLSVNTLTGAGDTVTGTTATNLMSIAQELIEIATYCATQSSFEQTVNGLGWAAGAQFQTDALTADGSGNYQLKVPARTNITVPDFVPGYAGLNNDIASSTDGLVLRAPLDAVNDMTCAECFRRIVRWIGAVGSPVVWFDYMTTPPTLKVGTRDVLPAKVLPFAGLAEAVKIKRRDDLIPSAIAFKYRISGKVNGTPYMEVFNDVAATVDGALAEGIGLFGALTKPDLSALSSDAQTQLPLQARRFAAQVGTFDFEGTSANQASGTIVTAALNLADPTGGGAPLAFWTALFPELANVTGLAFYHDAGGAVAPTVVNTGDAAINTSTFANILMDGNVAPWMYVNNSPTSGTPGQCVEATITAWFSYNDNAGTTGDPATNTGAVACHQKTIKLKLTNLTSGTYQSSLDEIFGEPVPYGLPGYIYAIESIPQYEGSYSLNEQDITDVCPVGNVLNFSMGLVEWTTMNACVQQISYEGGAGKTTLTFGPAKHLGNGDLVERLRVNRGPRWFILIGSDLLNATPSSGPTALGANVPLRGPSAGNKIPAWQITPSNLADFQQHGASYPTPPGVTHYGLGNAPPNASDLTDEPMTGPGWAHGGGSGGTPDKTPIICDYGQFQSLQPGTYKPITEVASVHVTAGGTGYTGAPTVTPSGGSGSGATFLAVIAGGAVVGVQVVSAGTGYTSAPALAFSGGGGTGAAATARLWGWEARWFEIGVTVGNDCSYFMTVFATPPYKKS